MEAASEQNLENIVEDLPKEVVEVASEHQENIEEDLPIEEVEAGREHQKNVVEDLRNEEMEAFERWWSGRGGSEHPENIVEDLPIEKAKAVSEHLKNVTVEDLRNEGVEAISEKLKRIMEVLRNEEVDMTLSLAEAQLRPTLTSTESNMGVNRVIKNITEQFTSTSAYHELEAIPGHAEAPLPNVPLEETVDSVLKYHIYRWEINQLENIVGHAQALQPEISATEEVLKKLRYDSVVSAEVSAEIPKDTFGSIQKGIRATKAFTEATNLLIELLQQARVEADAPMAVTTKQRSEENPNSSGAHPSSEEHFDENPNSSAAHPPSEEHFDQDFNENPS